MSKGREGGTFPKVVMVTMEITDEFRVYKEGRKPGHGDRLDMRAKEERASGMAAGVLGSEERSISERYSQLSLICPCRLVFLKALRLTSLKTNAIFYFITVSSKAGW